MYSYPYICCVIYDPPRIPVVHLVSPEPRSELEKLYAQDYAMLHTTSDWALARLSTRAREARCSAISPPGRCELDGRTRRYCHRHAGALVEKHRALPLCRSRGEWLEVPPAQPQAGERECGLMQGHTTPSLTSVLDRIGFPRRRQDCWRGILARSGTRGGLAGSAVFALGVELLATVRERHVQAQLSRLVEGGRA
jgi:hypothetical protein